MKRSITTTVAGTMGLLAVLSVGGCGKDEPPVAPPIRTTNAPPPPPATTKPPVVPKVSPPAIAPPTTVPVETAPKSTNVTPTSLPAATPPATQPVIEMPPAGSPQQDPKVAKFAGLSGPKPATWISHPPATQFAVAEYAIPGRDGADQGRIVVSTAGGTLDMNVARWKAQFRGGPDGGAVEPVISKVEAGDLSIDVVEFAGEYRGMGGGFTPGQLMITGIVPSTNNQQVFIKFIGPAKTVEANREAFMELLRGLKEVEIGK